MIERENARETLDNGAPRDLLRLMVVFDRGHCGHEPRRLKHANTSKLDPAITERDYT